MDKENRWIFFDVGSTLVDESLVYERQIKTMIEGTHIKYEEFYEFMIDKYKQNLKGDLEAAKHWGLTVPEWTSDGEVLYPETFSLLRNVSSRFNLGIIANQPRGTEDRLRRFGILGFFSVVLSSTEEGVAKPDRRFFELALNRANCRPDMATMVGDRLDNDIVPAKELGMKTIWIKQGFSSYSLNVLNTEKADYVVKSLKEIEEIIGII